MNNIFQGNASRLKNEMIWIYGWGKNEKGQISNQLMKTNVAVNEIVDDSVYLELIHDEGDGPCSGDSGGKCTYKIFFDVDTNKMI